MRVLITNVVLWPRTGTVTYVRDLALALVRRGDEVAVFSSARGPVCEELRAAGVIVESDVRRLPRPDVIHGHHHAPLRVAIAAFPGVPAVSVCHDHRSEHDRRLAHPAIRRHFAVSDICARRRVAEGISPDAVELLPNFVDLARFGPPRALPPRPRRAAIFSNHASEQTHLPAVRAACARAGLPLDVYGTAAGRPIASPEVTLASYDVVFAKARAALDAMAAGAAVVLCDFAGVGPLVRPSSFLHLQRLNFGFEALQGPLTPEAVGEQLAQYSPADAGAVCDLVAQHASLDQVVERLRAVYAACVEEGPAPSPRGVRDLASAVRAEGAVRVYWWWLSWPEARQHAVRRWGLQAFGRIGLIGRRARDGSRSAGA